jgi:tetratricopeptide (TPR) repeat protein
VRHVKSIAIILALATTSQAAAQSAAPTVATPAKPSAQAQYDELVKLVEAKNWSKAVPAGNALLARLNSYTKKNPIVIASVQVFLARAYWGASQNALALESVTAALDGGGLDGAAQLATRYDASLLAGEISEVLLDLNLASARYEVAASLGATPTEKGRAQASYVRTIMTIDPQKALAAANALFSILPDDKANKQIRAAVNSLRARALMNAGQTKEALALYEAAVKGLGGLTTRVDRNDVTARSDAALAAFLVGDDGRAREFMAYTGAGILKGEGFKLGREMRPPQCGGIDGLTPEDVAVIEFSVGDDGTVASVTPIYASRPGKVGLSFARAVESWWWKAEEVSKIEGFFRRGTRLQMRCTNATDRPEITSLLNGDYQAWLQKIAAKPAVFEESNVIKLAAAISTERKRREAITAVKADMLPLIDVALSKGGFAFGNQQNAAEAVSIAKAIGAPATALSHLQLRSANYPAKLVKSYQAEQVASLEALKGLLTDPAYSPDPRSQALLKLSIAAKLQSLKRFGEALIAFREAAALQGLDERDPIKVSALIQLASAEQGANNRAAATAAFTQSGLSARQCALADAKPPLLNINNGYGSFPAEALNWGFSGWVVTEYDIAASGKTDNIRTLIAYPPYVFASAASTMIKGAKYRETFRPDGGLSCGANSERITFLSGR